MSMMGAMAVQTDLRSAEARKKKLMGRRWLATGVGTIVAAATACLTFLARRPLGAEPALVDGLSGASPLSQTGWINLGSAFLIEDWLWDGMTAAERRSYDTPENPWRWHMSNLTKGQMESHLSSRISRANFAALAAYGVGVVRVPVGYWNFLNATELSSMDMGEPTPVSEVDLALMRRLHELMSPPEYAVHFKRLFRLAAEFGVRLILDLHGLPGSQNGEMHSGMRESSNKSTYARAERAHFASDANWELGWRTVEAMVSLCASLQTTPHLRDVLWGVQITNENNRIAFPAYRRGAGAARSGRPASYTPEATEGYTDLMLWYDGAIRRMRARGLPKEVAVVPFAWPWQLPTWSERMRAEPWLDFGSDHSTFGKVVWDTHVYVCNTNSPEWTPRCSFGDPPTPPGDPALGVWDMSSVTDASEPAYNEATPALPPAPLPAPRTGRAGQMCRLTLRAYNEVRYLKAFVASGNRVVVGEWALAGASSAGRKAGYGAGELGAVLAVIAETVARLYDDAGVDGHFLWTFGGGGVRDMGSWLAQNVGGTVYDAVEKAQGVPGALGRAASAAGVFRALWTVQGAGGVPAALVEEAICGA
mmetsp:Transcript_20129/g.66642  ORF Transcript_20129/g.66642 Transcript_20129/m.66642 type:complete len:591 (+) Transcript_20129:147-1919(+)